MEFRMQAARAILERAKEAGVLREQIEALEEAVLSKPSLAFDLAKSMVETICKTILADRGIKIEEGVSCPKLVKRTAAALRLIPEDHSRAQSREGVRDVVNGLVAAVQGLCVVRNQEGTASHGKDAFSRQLTSVHALLAARAADTVAAFLWGIHGADQAAVLAERLLYENQGSFNDWIDSHYEKPIEIMGSTLKHSEVLFHTDRIAYKSGLFEFEESVLKDAED